MRVYALHGARASGESGGRTRQKGGRERERGRSYTLPLYHSRRCVKYHALRLGTRSSSVTEYVRGRLSPLSWPPFKSLSCDPPRPHRRHHRRHHRRRRRRAATILASRVLFIHVPLLAHKLRRGSSSYAAKVCFHSYPRSPGSPPRCSLSLSSLFLSLSL
jgi:hypothetical protein